MNEGRLIKWDRLEFSVSGSFACSKSGLASFDGIARMSAASAYAPNATILDDGFVMEFETHYGSGTVSPSTDATLEIPILGVSESVSVSGAFSTSGSMRLEFDNFRVYCHGSAYFRVRFDAARWYVNGSLEWSTGATMIENVGYLTPTAIPLIGVPAIITPIAAYNPNEVYGPPSPSCSAFTSHIEISAAVSGGWRYREIAGGSWISPPVTIELLDIPELDCNDLEVSIDLPTASNTYDASVSAYSRLDYNSVYLGQVECNCPPGQETHTTALFDVYRTSLESVKRSNSVRLVPDLAKSVKRLGESEGYVYRAMVYRGGFPWTKKTAFAVCDDWTSGDTEPDSTTREDSEAEVHPEETEFLAAVGNAAHIIEEPLGFVTYAPASAGGSHFLGRSTCYDLIRPASCSIIGGGSAPDSDTFCGDIVEDAFLKTVGTSFGDSVQDYTGAGSNADLADYLVHDEALARYLNYVASPHWSYGLWFPPDTIDTDFDSIPDKQDQWNVDGGPIGVGYWIALRTQWAYQSALPIEEKTKTRTSILLEPLGRGALADWLKAYFLGTRSSWWGVHRFITDNTSPAESKALNIFSGVWTFEDCSALHQIGGLLLTPDPGATVIKATLNLGRFTGPPYLYPIISDRVKPDWDPDNVAGVTLTFIGRSGTSSTVIEATAGEIIDRPNGADDKYAASYAQDMGAGYLTDSGADSLPSGESAAYMAIPEGVHSFGLLAGYGAEELKFSIEIESDAADVLLKYPTFYASADPWNLFAENGNHEILIYENGPAFRFGNVAYFYSGAMQETPAILSPGEPPLYWKSSIVDFFGFRNNAYLARKSDFDVSSDLAALFDEDEGNTIADIDEFTVSALGPRSGTAPRGLLVASLREVPPTCVIPIGERDGATFEASGTPALESWSFTEERRIYVGNRRTDLVDGADSYMTPGTTVDGWYMTFHRRALENDEGSGFSVRRGGTEIGTFSPYHGLFSVRRGGNGEVTSVHSDITGLASLIFEVVVVEEGLTVFVYNLDRSPRYFREYDAIAREGINTAQIAGKVDGGAVIAFDSEEDEVSRIFTTRNYTIGETWTEPENIMNGQTPAICEAHLIGVELMAVRENDPGTAWNCYRKLAEDETWELAGEIVDGIDPGCSGLNFSSERGGLLKWSVSDGGTIRRFVSPNLGETWIEETI